MLAVCLLCAEFSLRTSVIAMKEGNLKDDTFISHPLLLEIIQALDDDVILPRVPEVDGGMFASALDTFQPTNDDVRVPDTHLAELDEFASEGKITSSVEIDRASTDDATVPDRTDSQPESGERITSTENLATNQTLVDDVIIPHTPEGFTGPGQFVETNETLTDDEESFIIPETRHIPDTTFQALADGRRQEDEQQEDGDVARDTNRTDDDECYEYSPPSPNNKLVYEEPNGCIIEIYEDVEVEDEVSSQGTSPRSEDDFDPVELDDDDDGHSARIGKNGEEDDNNEGHTTADVDYQKLDRDEMTRDLQMPDYLEDNWIDDDIEEVDRYRDVNLLHQGKEATNNKGLTYQDLSRHLEDAAEEEDEATSITPDDDHDGEFAIVHQLQPVALQQHLRDESDEISVDLDHPDMYSDVKEYNRVPQQQQQQLQRKRQGCLRRCINRVASFFNCA